MLLSHLAISWKHFNTICCSNGIQTDNHLVRKRILNHFAKLAKWLVCIVSTYLYGIHLNFRYRACFEEGAPWHSGNYRLYIHSEIRTWHDNNIQGLNFPGAIKIVTTRFIIVTVWWPMESEGQLYRMINITFYFSA